MSEPTGPVCPQCGTPRATDGTPACSCGRRASDAHRETRTAQAAAAEDFDPVRIRPFVKLEDDTHDADDTDDADDTHDGDDADDAYVIDGSAAPADVASASHTDEPVGSSKESTTVVGPRLTEASLLDEQPPADSAQDGQRRWRRAALAAGVAVVAVLVTGGIFGGLFLYQTPSRDGSLPDDARASLPEAASDNDAPSANPSRTASSTQPSETPATSPAATSTRSQATPTGSTVPTGPPSGSGATATAAPAPTRSDAQDPVLSFGDKGPEVTELQLRLWQVGLYDGDVDGDYNSQVESAVRGYQLTRVVLDDESGVYGKATRASLESETSEP